MRWQAQHCATIRSRRHLGAPPAAGGVSVLDDASIRGMLSYRHAFHAGNYGDVLKHLVLVGILEHLLRKPGAVRYIDTHAGAGGYRLDSAEALRTAEFQGGIGLLWNQEDLPEALARYVALVRAYNAGGTLSSYPGSPWFARHLLRGHDRLDLCELHPRDFATLQAGFSKPRNIRCHAADGFAVSLGLVPPVERRGLVLIDPSYELKQDYEGVVTHVRGLHRRFATGIYMVWYPIVDGARALRMEKGWRNSGLRRIHLYELSLTRDHRHPGMTGAGVVIVNPPWGLANAVEASLRCFTPLIGNPGESCFRVEELVGE
jgi:23S rRNA (adenine2030-N6)-methyltransferase